MSLLKPMPAGSTYYGAGGQYAKSHGRPLPAQQEQETDVFGILDQQYQQEIKDLNVRVAQVQEETLRKTRYELQKLSEKYQIERKYIEGLKVPADQKRQKLLQLNTKYELAATTAKSKVRPEIDVINSQRQQMSAQLQQGYQQKQRDLKLVQQMVDEGIIQDPYVALQKQYAMVGKNYPISAFRPPKELSLDELMMAQATIDYKIGNLEAALETATGEDRKAIAAELVDLNRERTELMGAVLPEHKSAIDKSNKMTNVGLQMQAGRKPGTMAEGIWQKKQKQIRPTVQKRHWAAGPGMPEVKKQKEIKAQATPVELRAQGTKEAYERGKELGYWN